MPQLVLNNLPSSLSRAAALGFLILALGVLALAGCAPFETPAPGDAWAYTDLRALSPADAGMARLDLVALYTRLARTDFQIRLDLLDVSAETKADIYVALDTRSGGIRRLPFDAQADIDWDILIAIPQTGPPRAFAPARAAGGEQAGEPAPFVELAGLIPRAARVPWLDSLIITLNSAAVSPGPAAVSVEAFALRPGGKTPVDRIGPVRSDGAPPGRAAVLLAFWNTFPAYTPAQALRRWDGAHTGPFGERHGLHVLLQNVRRYRVPVLLLDLKNPAWLAALDTVGGLPLVQELAERGLVELPDAAYGSPSFPYFPEGLPDWAGEQSVEDSRDAAAQFGLPAARTLYAPRWQAGLSEGYSLMFTEGAAVDGGLWRGTRLLPVPLSSADLQANDEGLSLEVRRRLLANAIAAGDGGSPDRLVLLGGSLPDSAFGDPQASEAAFIYLAGHPWMMPIGTAGLGGLSSDPAVDRPGNGPAPSAPEEGNPFSPILAGLPRPSASRPLEMAAWQSALSLYQPLPPESDQLQPLRALYSSQVGGLDIARQWAEAPQPIQQCTADVDLDGLPECILASPDVYASFDLLGGRLRWLFVRSESGVHQLVGPSSQFVVGLSDPSEYDFSVIDAADPAAIAGGLADTPPPWALYSGAIDRETLGMSAPDGKVTKSFRLDPNGLIIEYHAGGPGMLQVPLVLDPWKRDAPGWAERYQLRPIQDGWAWSLKDGPVIEIRSSAPAAVQAFNASLGDLRQFEDPNRDYPPGHYLPFPLALLEIQSPGDFSLEISLVD